MDGKIIRNISLTGSIHCIPVQLVEEMEAGIRGIEGREEVVSEIIQKLFRRPGVQAAGCSPENFVRHPTVEKARKVLEVSQFDRPQRRCWTVASACVTAMRLL
jgi:hypothetical protein